MSNADQNALAALACAYAMSGRRSEAEKILFELQQKSKVMYISPYLIATIYAGLGEKGSALQLLEKLCREKSPDLVWYLKSDLRIDSLRSDPRFKALLRQANFPHT